MTQLIFKTDIDQAKLDILLSLLKTWGIDAEVKPSKSRTGKNQELFTETFGMWKDYDIDAKELRRQASTRFYKSDDSSADTSPVAPTGTGNE
ncbi:MAG: hypothetical protein LBI58_05310 [Tannerellaceae bacterium]|jgi:hypothetical protein|nr:hypothetical protein [Tannerellaceae bacterium]